MTKNELQAFMPPDVNVDGLFSFLKMLLGKPNSLGQLEGEYCGIRFCAEYVFVSRIPQSGERIRITMAPEDSWNEIL